MNYLLELDNEHIWKNDGDIICCHNCKNMFGLFNRRHHCRICGNIFCNNCSNNILNTNIKQNDKELIKIEDYLLECLNTKINIYNYKKKICEKCNILLNEIKKISKIIIIIELLPLKLDNIYKLLLVNKIWNKSSLYYLYKFKKFSKLTIYNNIDIKIFNILNINLNYICGHDKLVILYI